MKSIQKELLFWIIEKCVEDRTHDIILGGNYKFECKTCQYQVNYNQ